MQHLHVFIMAGGSGERFWPMSRTTTPKHLLRLVSDRTLLEEAVLRALAIVPADRVYVLTNESQLEACRGAASVLPPAQFIAEPAKRDTAPAAALATAIARSKDPHAICALFPADSMIHDSERFAHQVLDAADAVEGSTALLTFAINPTYPATGFGYLELGEQHATGQHGSVICRVTRFVEKPDLETAEGYLASGNFGWNAGMFLWQASSFLAECERLNPPLAGFIREFPSTDFISFLLERFPSLPKISVDYAIMEQAAEVLSVRAEFDWDDVGAWTALPAHLGVDSEGNTVRGAVTLLDAKNNIVVSNSRTIAVCGVRDLVIVETDDALLVCHRDAAQLIKNLQPHLPPELK
jgi:mannose-1-phosphate guanylyltransferase